MSNKSRNSTLHGECLFCSSNTKLRRLASLSQSTQLIEALVKFLYFYPIPLKSCQESLIINESMNREIFYENLFQITSICYHCLLKVHNIRNYLEEFQKLQELLKILQFDIMGLLQSCSTADHDNGKSLMNYYRIAIKQELEMARANLEGHKPKFKITDGMTQNQIKPPAEEVFPVNKTLIVQLTRLEDLGIHPLESTTTGYKVDDPDPDLQASVSIKEESNDYQIPGIVSSPAENSDCHNSEFCPSSPDNELNCLSSPSKINSKDFKLQQNIQARSIKKKQNIHGLANKLNLSVRSLPSLDCNYCSESFPTAKCGQFWIHLKTKHPGIIKISLSSDESKFKCPFCQIQLRTKNRQQATLWVHIINKHSSLVLKNWKPKDSSLLLKRKARNEVNTKFNGKQKKQVKLICKLCAESESEATEAGTSEFYRLHHFWVHFYEVHSEIFKSDVSEYQQKISTEDSTKCQQKLENSTSPQNYCGLCPKSFTLARNRKVHHYKVHTKEFIRNPEDYDSYRKKIKEKGNSNNTNTQQFICEQCGNSYKTANSLRNHLPRHNPEFDQHCPFCPGTSKSKQGLQSHLLTHHPIEASTKFNLTGYKCEQCNKVLSSAYSLKIHTAGSHSKEYRFYCNLCDYKCLVQANLKLHIKRIHTKERNFVCKFCTKTFVRNNDLNVHLNIHTNDKQFECQYCNKKFHMKKHLQRHEPIHQTTIERPFLQCKLCDSKFPTQNNLYGHLKSHHKNGTERIGIKPKRKSKYDD